MLQFLLPDNDAKLFLSENAVLDYYGEHLLSENAVTYNDAELLLSENG